MVELNIQQLSRRYGHHTVIDNLTVRTSNSPLGISGSNGSGKSTLLKCLSGLLKPSEGSIEWSVFMPERRRDESTESLSASGTRIPETDGPDTTSGTPQEMRESIGFAAPYVELYETMTVTENLAFLLQLHNSNHNNDSMVDLQKLLDDCQALEFADHLYGELSTGQRQRAKLAAATIHSPDILCLDEPGSNLDKKGRDLIRATVERFRKSGAMVLIASNQPAELDMCNQTVNLDDMSGIVQ